MREIAFRCGLCNKAFDVVSSPSGLWDTLCSMSRYDGSDLAERMNHMDLTSVFCDDGDINEKMLRAIDVCPECRNKIVKFLKEEFNYE